MSSQRAFKKKCVGRMSFSQEGRRQSSAARPERYIWGLVRESVCDLETVVTKKMRERDHGGRCRDWRPYGPSWRRYAPLGGGERVPTRNGADVSSGARPRSLGCVSSVCMVTCTPTLSLLQNPHTISL